MICEWGQSFRLVFAHPLSTQGRLRLRCSLGSPCLPRGAVCRSRLRGCPFGTRYGLSSHRNAPKGHSGVFSVPTAHCAVGTETLMLQVRSAHPPMPHRTSSSSCSGVSVGLFSDSAPTHLRCAGVPLGLFGKPKRSSFSRVRGLHQAILWLDLQNARPSGSLRSPSDGRGELRSPLSPHRNVFSKHPGVPVGLFSTKSTQYSLLQNARPPAASRPPVGGGSFAPPCTPLSRPPGCAARVLWTSGERAPQGGRPKKRNARVFPAFLLLYSVVRSADRTGFPDARRSGGAGGRRRQRARRSRRRRG